MPKVDGLMPILPSHTFRSHDYQAKLDVADVSGKVSAKRCGRIHVKKGTTPRPRFGPSSAFRPNTCLMQVPAGQANWKCGVKRCVRERGGEHDMTGRKLSDRRNGGEMASFQLAFHLAATTISSCPIAFACAAIRASPMEKPTALQRDSDSDRSPSDNEKVVGVEPGAFESATASHLPPDPDEGLTDAEKAKIVSRSPYTKFGDSGFGRTEHCYGSSTSASSPGSASSTSSASSTGPTSEMPDWTASRVPCISQGANTMPLYPSSSFPIRSPSP